MSRTYKDRRYKTSQGTNSHHCINKSSWWRTVEENMLELKERTHKEIHILFGNKLPHEIIERILETVCKPMVEDMKKELYNVLDKYEWKEYKENTYHWKKAKHGPYNWTL